MIRWVQQDGEASPAEALAFIHAAFQAQQVAVVPARDLPLLTRHAGCRPLARKGEEEACFLFDPARAVEAGGKRVNRLLGACLLLVLSPLALATALAVLMLDGRPVFFIQERYGRGGRPFRLIKFRTMVRGAEHLHARLQRRQGRPGKLFKLACDPRVTRIGAFLRRTFLDELPQIVNVARGEMRLVGPRPLPASDQEHYTCPGHALRLLGDPGLTGLWQVSGRNDRTFDEMCLLDLYYLCNRSWTLDAAILWRTVLLIARPSGAARKAAGCGEKPSHVQHDGRCRG